MRLFLLGLLSLSLTGACGDGLGGLLISNQDEVELGFSVDQQLRIEYPIADPADPASIWLQEFITPLVEASRPFRTPENFGGYKVAIIVDDELINAFAAPGGFTYLTTGLILQSTTCGEIAGVMGHELAHITERHTVKKIEDAYALSAISSWFLGDGLSNDIALGIYGFLSNTQFSQAHETEADVVGLQISYGAGYNPFGLADFFRRLLELSGGASVPQFLSSHPANQTRIDRVSREIVERYGDAVIEGETQTYNCVGTTLSFEQLKAHITGVGVAITPGTGTGIQPEPIIDPDAATPDNTPEPSE